MIKVHMATGINKSMFTISFNDTKVSREAVFPNWNSSSRLGVVIRQPFGALGASLLIQLAVTAFYDASPFRRDSSPQYPEIYLFHVGGPHGDHRPFDFWPPRKEIFLEGADPIEILEAVNDRAITTLTLPQTSLDMRAPDEPTSRFSSSGAPWSEINSFSERTTATYLYSPTGALPEGDLKIGALCPVLQDNARRTARPEISLEWFRSLRDEQLPNALPGPGDIDQTRYWAETLHARFNEVHPEARTDYIASTRDRDKDEQHTEIYKSIKPTDAFVHF